MVLAYLQLAGGGGVRGVSRVGVWRVTEVEELCLGQLPTPRPGLVSLSACHACLSVPPHVSRLLMTSRVMTLVTRVPDAVEIT